MNVVWSPRAIERVLEAAEQIALDKPGAATCWAKSTFDAVERLERYPESGRVVPELERSEVREIIHGSYRVIYRIEETRVLNLTVRHTSRQLDPSETE